NSIWKRSRMERLGISTPTPLATNSPCPSSSFSFALPSQHSSDLLLDTSAKITTCCTKGFISTFFSTATS
ncbi:unnamed protein product, partial [Nesidiocoris tenuis]